MPITDVSSDPQALTLTVTGEYPVPVQRLWDAYADPRQLERFWGPEGWPATFTPPTILDVGSGLCVFLHRMRIVAGWECTALDPDVRAVQHAQSTAGVNGVCGDFMSLTGLGSYDVITFNKVLEHVPDPVAMLARSADFVRPGGFVYVELPDGEKAAEVSFDREHIYVDHHHVLSTETFRWLAARAAFAVVDLQRLREPSGKYTLFAFLQPLAAAVTG
jgi:2-polyprenyl-3-methyl-5-hydroxy-6-metoxy-1,4-benzoquinol methylase